MGLKLKKSLGQHFLTDEDLCQRIVAQSTVASQGNLVEVGPGGGAITKYLLELEHINFRVIEIDDEKVAYLPTAFPKIEGKIIHTDFLVAERPFGDERFSIIGNFPYNISTQIMFRVYEWESHVDEVVGMFQKEVAQRIAAKPGSKVYGILSVLIQAFYDVEYLFDIPPTAFNPPPKVLSGVIRLERNSVERLDCDEKLFWQVVKAGFNQRRKTLRNSLSSLINKDKMIDSELLNLRAERLSVADFVTLTNMIASAR